MNRIVTNTNKTIISISPKFSIIPTSFYERNCFNISRMSPFNWINIVFYLYLRVNTIRYLQFTLYVPTGQHYLFIPPFDRFLHFSWVCQGTVRISRSRALFGKNKWNRNARIKWVALTQNEFSAQCINVLPYLQYQSNPFHQIPQSYILHKY